MGLVFILKANFILRSRKVGGKIAKGSEKVWRKRLHERKEARDSDDGKSYGNGTSMVLGQGQKT